MRAPRTLSILAGTAAVALASLAIAAPASAATIASGQKISVVDLILAEVGPTGSRFNDVDPANAAVTPVGNVQAPDSVLGVDVNDDGIGYAVAFYTENPQSPDEQQSWVPVLMNADAKNGTLGDFVDIVPTDDEIVINQCTGIDLQPNGEIRRRRAARGVRGLDHGGPEDRRGHADAGDRHHVAHERAT